MIEIRNQTLSGDVRIDDTYFIDCIFDKATLIFEGGTPPGFKDCRFANSRFGFTGAAGNTVNLLRAMAPQQTGMRMFVTGLIPELGIN